jgi:4-amino-4-deoxy-L-arabinose transferase-like glycosyltransferase
LSPRLRWALTALFSLLPLLGWWDTGLFDLDEGFYGAVTAEMNRRGEWITPYYNGKPWFEKPILLYWLAKPALALFGEAFGPRLPSVLCTLATYGIVGAYVTRKRDLRAGTLAVGILSSSLLVVAIGRMMMTDAPLMLAMTGAFLAFWESLNGDRRWRLLTASCLGVGVLAKGPVAILLFLPVAAWTFWRQPELRSAYRGQWLWGTVILLAVVATWYLSAYAANGQLFVQKFLIEQNIGRFTGGDAAHTVGVVSLPLYAVVVLVGMLPWSFWIPASWPRRDADPLVRFLAAWAGTVFLFFTLSSAKLPHYVLPLFPPLAMLVALRLADRKWAWPTALAMGAVMCLVANGAFAWWYVESGQAEAHRLARYVRAKGGEVVLYQMPRRERDRGTGGTQLRETSLPSVVMVLDRAAPEVESLAEVRQSSWIFTRRGRIDPSDAVEVKAAGGDLEEVPVPGVGKRFTLYRLSR